MTQAIRHKPLKAVPRGSIVQVREYPLGNLKRCLRSLKKTTNGSLFWEQPWVMCTVSLFCIKLCLNIILTVQPHLHLRPPLYSGHLSSIPKVAVVERFSRKHIWKEVHYSLNRSKYKCPSMATCICFTNVRLHANRQTTTGGTWGHGEGKANNLFREADSLG